MAVVLVLAMPSLEYLKKGEDRRAFGRQGNTMVLRLYIPKGRKPIGIREVRTI